MPVTLVDVFKPAPELSVIKVHAEQVKCGFMQTKARHYRVTFNKSTFAFGEPIKVRFDWDDLNTSLDVSCVKFKIRIKCAWREEKTVYRVKFTKKNFEIKGTSVKSINLHFAVNNPYYPWTIFQNRSMMPPSYTGQFEGDWY
jgi:hypothetical protein